MPPTRSLADGRRPAAMDSASLLESARETSGNMSSRIPAALVLCGAVTTTRAVGAGASRLAGSFVSLTPASFCGRACGAHTCFGNAWKTSRSSAKADCRRESNSMSAQASSAMQYVVTTPQSVSQMTPHLSATRSSAQASAMRSVQSWSCSKPEPAASRRHSAHGTSEKPFEMSSMRNSRERNQASSASMVPLSNCAIVTPKYRMWVVDVQSRNTTVLTKLDRSRTKGKESLTRARSRYKLATSQVCGAGVELLQAPADGVRVGAGPASFA
mmetsp:Transcript_109320/g.304081  ORF Transcript_109320/g.304081 Transcript_109320/m.304081 type:complete len:271 (+) Transcript_109320:136-948(+)